MNKNDALNILKELHDKVPFPERNALEAFVPELKYSYDNKVRKALTEHLSNLPDYDTYSGVKASEMLAWVEKQKDASLIDSIQLSDYDKDIIGAIEYCIKFNCQFEKEHIEWLGKFLEKIKHKLKSETTKEEKSDKTDNAIPKFKEGDWIINEFNKEKFCVLDYNANYGYKLETLKGISFHCSEDYIDKYFHLWTIQDAKDGDILASENTTIIFKAYDDKEKGIWSHCDATKDRILICSSFWDLIEDWKPASKIQRERLFQQIKEAGYEWDSENKELRLLVTNGGDFETENTNKEVSNKSLTKKEEQNTDKKLDTVLIDKAYIDSARYACVELYGADSATVKWFDMIKNRILQN